jgi:hypothetical protein
VTVGDDVLIWGDTEAGRIQVLDVAEAMGSIPYEITCGVSRRVRRVWLCTIITIPARIDSVGVEASGCI